MGLFRRSLKTQLRRIDRRIQLATDRFVAGQLIRAAQLSAGAGDLGGALRYYGRAVDAYLSIGQGREAETLCRTMIELKPNVVRARRTLALILLGRGDLLGAAEQVREYVAAARGAGQEQLAVRQLRLMAELTQDDRLRESLLAQCGELGAEIAEPGARTPTVSSRALEADAGRWMSALRLAMTTPDEINHIWSVAAN
jgi:predicted Zn-dependent protease